MKIRKSKLIITLLYNLISFIIACFLTRIIIQLLLQPVDISPHTLIIIMGLFFITYFYLIWKNLYSKNHHYYLKNTYLIVMKNAALAVSIILFITSIFKIIEKLHFFPNLFIYLIMGALSFSIMHGSQFLWIKYLSNLGYFRKNSLVIGNPDERFPLSSYFQDIGNTKNYIGMVNYKNGRWIWKPTAKQIFNSINTLDDLKSLILKENIGEIIFFLGDVLQQDLLLNIVNFCQTLSIGYYLVPDIAQLPNKHPWNKIFPYIPVLERFTGNRDSLTNISIKRLLDIIISTTSLILLIPLGLLIAFAIKIEDSGPVFYITTRVGKNGIPIRFFKFRTMIVNAEKEKQKLLKFNERDDGPLFKMKDDPRVTKVGIILRKYSLDEIPQLVNVLLGNMSLIGPRPHLPEEVAEYKNGDYLRLECIPGIVCLPQITGRNTLGFREWVDLDLKYRKNWSIALDFKIMLKTIKIILAPFMRHGHSVY